MMNINGEVYYNLNNILDVITELGEGDFTFSELIRTIEDLFPYFSEDEKQDLALKTIKIIKILK